LPTTSDAATSATKRRGIPPTVATGILVAIYFAIAVLIPRPATVKPEGWRLLGIFVATIAGLILQPIAGGAIVLLAITLAALFGGLTIQHALAGFGDPVVWLVMAAFFISDALIKTGLARRIALFFVRTFGRSTLGVCYALGLTDFVLAGIIPSNGARSGGVVLPIVRSVAQLYGSEPGESARKIGCYLMVGVYQAICITAAMFLTGQASNPLAAQISTNVFHVPITWPRWIGASIVPGMLSLAIVPWIVYKLYPPMIQHTPEAAQFAHGELVRMGRMNRGELIVCGVFAGVCALWIFSPLDITVSALLGSGVLLLSGVLTWHEVTSNHAAWDIFIWYGGLYQLGKSLNDAGVTSAFADGVASALAGYGSIALFMIALLIYFYAHYGFASITAHILAMYAAFGSVLIAKGVPPGLVAFALACFGNLCAGLTNYGTTPSPMFYAQGYVDFATWWRIGLIVSFANILIWSTAGFAWWRFLGIW
jgi:divalent anion:Na+ symporter, DASS family